jgi:hypothetical protein
VKFVFYRVTGFMFPVIKMLKKGGKIMAKEKNEKPRYETPVVTKLDELEKASGGVASSCSSGSAAGTCTSGAVAGLGCSAGSTFTAPTR